MTPELKLCPFCGEKAEVHSDGKSDKTLYWWVECTNVNCSCSAGGDVYSNHDGMTTSWCQSEGEAVDMWNKRVNPWNYDMDSAKGVGRVIIETYVDCKRVISTGGWDDHWTGECWVYDDRRILNGTIPVAWMPLPVAWTGS